MKDEILSPRDDSLQKNYLDFEDNPCPYQCGFKINQYDECIYIKDTKDRFFILCLYVDDILIV